MKVTEDEIIEAMKEANIYPDEGLESSLPFSEQGVDSLDRTSLFLAIEEKFGIKLPEGQEDQYNTLSKMLSYINGK